MSDYAATETLPDETAAMAQPQPAAEGRQNDGADGQPVRGAHPHAVTGRTIGASRIGRLTTAARKARAMEAAQTTS